MLFVRGESLRGTAGHVRICPTARALSRLGLSGGQVAGVCRSPGEIPDGPDEF